MKYDRSRNAFRIGEVFYWRGRTPGGRPRIFGDHRMGFLHAHKDGAPVLRGHATLWTVCGFYANVFGGFFTVQFRRFWR